MGDGEFFDLKILDEGQVIISWLFKKKHDKAGEVFNKSAKAEWAGTSQEKLWNCMIGLDKSVHVFIGQDKSGRSE